MARRLRQQAGSYGVCILSPIDNLPINVFNVARIGFPAFQP
jgi:hypothetical protein